MKKKSLIRIPCFLVILSLVMAFTFKVLSFKYCDGIYDIQKFYSEDKNSIDVLVLGSSRSFENVNTEMMFEDYGIAAFDLCGSNQPLWNTYFYLKEALKTQSPKLIILDAYETTYNDDYMGDNTIIKNTFGMKWSMDKIKAICVSVQPERRLQFLLPYIQYHNRYTEVSGADFLKDQGDPYYADWKGFLVNMAEKPIEETTFEPTDEQGKIWPKAEEYLRKTIQLAEDNDIPVFVTVSPSASKTREEQIIYNSVEHICLNDYDNVAFVNFNEFNDRMGIDYLTDAADECHLNYKGNVKYTKLLSEMVKSRYDIPDRRNDPRYASWQRNVEYMKKYIEEYNINR